MTILCALLALLVANLVITILSTLDTLTPLCMKKEIHEKGYFCIRSICIA